MPELANFSTYLKIDGNPYPKILINYKVAGNHVTIYYIDQDRNIITGRFTDYTKDGVNYVSINTLIADLDKYLFDGSDFMLNVAAGKVPGHIPYNKFGANAEIANNTTEDIWDGGGTYNFPATALITDLSQTADQAAMRGQLIQAQGLDEDWNLVVQTKALDATLTTTAVKWDTAMIRTFRMKVLANVVSNSPIRAHNAAEDVDYAIIQSGNNQTLMAIFTVPAGQTAFMPNYYCDYVRDAAKDPDAINFTLWGIDRANDYAPQIKHEKGIPKQVGGFQHFFSPYYKFTEKTDILIKGKPTGADANAHAGFDLILIDN